MPTEEAKPAIKLIYANSYRIDEPDDPSYPLIMEAILRVPSFMEVAAMFILGGNERAVALGMTEGDLMEWARKSDNIPNHPRLIRITITDRKGVVIRSKRWREPWIPAPQDLTVAEHIRSHLLPVD